MKTLLCISLGEISTGELSIAISFEGDLPSDKYKCFHIIPWNKKGIMPEERMDRVCAISDNNKPIENMETILNYITTVKPDLIVLFDVFTFEYAQSWTGVNLKRLKSLNIPIASLDEYEYTKAGYVLDYYGMFIKRLPPLLNECDFIIKNCPLTMPPNYGSIYKLGENKNQYYYRVFDSTSNMSPDEKTYIKEKYITQKENKVILVTTSEWEVKGAYSFSAQNKLISWLGRIIYNYVGCLGEKVTILHIGSGKWDFTMNDSNIEYVYYEGLESSIYNKVLQAVDLYITFNVVSITLSKAIFAGIPALVLNNKKIIDFENLKGKLKEKPEWYQDMAEEVKKVYPFSASMFGWSSFLKEVLTDNIYEMAYEKVDMFHMGNTVKKLQDLLYNEKAKEECLANRNRFYNEYFKIPKADKLLDNLFQDNIDNK